MSGSRVTGTGFKDPLPRRALPPRAGIWRPLAQARPPEAQGGPRLESAPAQKACSAGVGQICRRGGAKSLGEGQGGASVETFTRRIGTRVLYPNSSTAIKPSSLNLD